MMHSDDNPSAALTPANSPQTAPTSNAIAGIVPMTRTVGAVQGHRQRCVPSVQQLAGRDRRNCESSVTFRWQIFLCKHNRETRIADHRGGQTTELS
jgi:hypothetical protein